MPNIELLWDSSEYQDHMESADLHEGSWDLKPNMFTPKH